MRRTPKRIKPYRACQTKRVGGNGMALKSPHRAHVSSFDLNPQRPNIIARWVREGDPRGDDYVRAAGHVLVDEEPVPIWSQ